MNGHIGDTVVLDSCSFTLSVRLIGSLILCLQPRAMCVCVCVCVVVVVEIH